MQEALNSRSLVWLAVALAIAGFALFTGVLLAGADGKIGAASAFLVASAAVFTAAVKFYSEERDHAFDFLEKAQENADLLRVRPESSSIIAKLSQHESDRSETEEEQPGDIEVFPILRQSSTAVEPCD